MFTTRLTPFDANRSRFCVSCDVCRRRSQRIKSGLAISSGSNDGTNPLSTQIRLVWTSVRIVLGGRSVVCGCRTALAARVRWAVTLVPRAGAVCHNDRSPQECIRYCRRMYRDGRRPRTAARAPERAREVGRHGAVIAGEPGGQCGEIGLGAVIAAHAAAGGLTVHPEATTAVNHLADRP